jgi:O-antigen/teichoic acid export membrane protein
MTFLTPALSLAGLPALSIALDQSYKGARTRAIKLSLLAVLAAGLYVCALLIAGGSSSGMLATVFGQSFVPYGALLLPVTFGQIADAAGLGGVLLLKAGRAGRPLAKRRIVGVASGLLAAALLIDSHGLIGAAWGYAVGLAIASVLIVSRSLRPFDPD